MIKRFFRRPFRRRALVMFLLAMTGGAPNTSAEAGDPAAVQEVYMGTRTEANAKWWGYDAEDATEILQAAIDSGVKRLIVPYMGQPWIVRPIRLRGNLELVFEPGVVIWAKQGEFKGKGDALFTAASVTGLTLRGYGATFRMRHEDYLSSAYEKAEWRSTVDLAGCTNVLIEGLRLESSGGDGIYVGCTAQQPYCQDVIVRNVICSDHHRQGISVIGAQNLLIENCELSHTHGTAPEAGIDFEPNLPEERLVNCVVRNCSIRNNKGAGILIYLKNLTRESEPVSLRFENCHIIGSNDVGMGIGAVSDQGPQGLIEFAHCVVEGPAKAGAYLYDKSARGARVRFVNCHWREVWSGANAPEDGPRAPLMIHARRSSLSKENGGIEFADCHVYDTIDRPVLAVERADKSQGVVDLTGRLFLHSPFPARIDPGSPPIETGLVVISAP